jgi:hypothetical protein
LKPQLGQKPQPRRSRARRRRASGDMAAYVFTGIDLPGFQPR